MSQLQADRFAAGGKSGCPIIHARFKVEAGEA